MNWRPPHTGMTRLKRRQHQLPVDDEAAALGRATMPRLSAQLVVVSLTTQCRWKLPWGAATSVALQSLRI